VGDAVLNIAGDSAGAQKAFDALRKQVTQLREELKQCNQAQKTAGAEMDALARSAKRVYDETRTPQEQHAQRLRDLGTLLNQGKISYETWGRATKKAHEDLNQQLSQTSQGHVGLGRLVSDWKGQIGGIVAGYLSIQGAQQLITQEMQRQEELRHKAAEATKTLATAQREFLINYLAAAPRGMTEEQKTAASTAALARIAALSKETGVSERDLTLRASAIFSSRQGATEQMAWEAVRESARVQPGELEGGRAMGVGAMDLMKVAEGISAARAMGMMVATAGMSHVWDVARVAEHGAPAIAAVAKTGGTPEEAAALFAWSTLALKDWTGAQSAVAARKAALSLEEWLPEKDRPVVGTVDGRLVSVGMRKGTALKSWSERVDWLRTHPKEAAQIIEKMEFGRGAMKPFFRAAVLDPVSSEWKMMDELRKTMGTGQQMETEYQTMLGAMGVIPALRVAGIGRRIQTKAEEIAVANRPEAIVGAIEPEFENFMLQMGESAFARTRGGFMGTRFASGRFLEYGPENALQSMIDRAASLRAGYQPMEGLLGRLFGEGGDRRRYEELGEMLVVLRAQLEEIREMRKAQQETNRKGAAHGAGAVNQHSE
jgi:hypothetical protein